MTQEPHPLDEAIATVEGLIDAHRESAETAPDGRGDRSEIASHVSMARALRILLNQVQPRPMDAAPKDGQIVRLQMKRGGRWRLGFFVPDEGPRGAWNVMGGEYYVTPGSFSGWLPVDPWMRSRLLGEGAWL